MDDAISERTDLSRRFRDKVWYLVLCALGGIWAVGFLAYGTVALIEWSSDNWSLHREFGRVIRIGVSFILFAGGAAVAIWSYAQVRPEPRSAPAPDDD